MEVKTLNNQNQKRRTQSSSENLKNKGYKKELKSKYKFKICNNQNKN